MPNITTWPLPPHSAAKHEMLRLYLYHDKLFGGQYADEKMHNPVWRHEGRCPRVKSLRRLVVLGALLPLFLASASLTLPTLPVAASSTAKINYVALGDSYSSGEGLAAQASGYITNLGYNTGKDGCHRAIDAYPGLVKNGFGANLGSFTFVACSGAYSGFTVSAFDKGGSMVSGRDGEAPQIPKEPVATNYLNSSVNDISLTIGGNDAGFADVVTSCASIMLKTGPVQQVTGIPPSMTGGSCASRLALSNKVIGNGTAISELGQGLVQTYETILGSATNARLAVLTYPQLLTPRQIPTSKFCPLTGGALISPLTGTTAYLGLNSKVQGDINAMEATANHDIMSAVAAVAVMPAYQGRIRVVNLTAATTPYAQPCNTKTMSQSDINGIDLALGDGIIQTDRCIFRVNSGASCVNIIGTQTLHPTAAGHQRMATAAEAAFKANWESTTTSTSLPTTTTTNNSPNVATEISAGTESTCALLASATVDCWGYNYYGELGDGSTINSTVPVTVTGLSGVKQISVGGVSNCALLASGTVDCWGLDLASSLGSSMNVDSLVPLAVTGLSGVKQISNSPGETCLILTNGSADCWGVNEYGQLGNGVAFPSSPVPVAVKGLSGVKQISIGNVFTCALLVSGIVDCWGWNIVGELGNGTTSNDSNPTPAIVTGLSGVIQISANADSNYACALLASGTVDCWGDLTIGEPGQGINLNASSFVPVVGLSGVTQISAGDGGICALVLGGAVECWGANLGNGTTNDSSVPVIVSGL